MVNRTLGVLCLVRVGDCPARCPDNEIERLKALIDGHGFVRLPEAPATPASARLRSERRCGSRPGLSAGCQDCTPASRRASASSSCSMFSAGNARSRSLPLWSRRNEGSHAVDQGGAHRIARRDRHDASAAGQHPRASGSMARAADFEAQRARSSSPCAHAAGAPGQGPRRVKPTAAQAAERQLLAAMADNPGLSVVALANAAGSSRAATGERLRQMAARGVVEKDLTGRWKLKGEEKEPGPTSPPSNLTAAAGSRSPRA